MRYAPDIPPLKAGLEGKWKAKGLTETRMVKAVHERAFPTLELQRRTQPEAFPAQARQLETRYAEPYRERRAYSRRICRQSVLIEFRSGKERRQHSQFGSGKAEHIDEEV